MKYLKIGGLTLLGYAMSIEVTYATGCPPSCDLSENSGSDGSIIPAFYNPCCPNGTAIPEIDGSGAILALGLVAGLVALVRERYFRK